jgi:hypothetical protein
MRLAPISLNDMIPRDDDYFGICSECHQPGTILDVQDDDWLPGLQDAMVRWRGHVHVERGRRTTGKEPAPV